MSRYDDLRAAFTVWHDEAMNVRNIWMRFPAVMADKTREYLGAPEQFSDLAFEENTKRYRYVSPATATWNVTTQSFDLKLKEGGLVFVDFDLHPIDGRFYFGLAIFLERSAKSYPKQPFWFLFSLGLEDQGDSSLRIQRTADVFPIAHAAPYSETALAPVCEVISRLLLEDLSTSPYARRDEQKPA